MTSRKLGFLFALVFGFSSAGQAVTSSATSESTDSVSSTSGSIRRIFTQNEKEKLQFFVDQNYERLEEEAARGTGVILNDYALLLGCKDSEALVGKAMQKNYRQLFRQGKSALTQETENMINGDSALALACEARS